MSTEHRLDGNGTVADSGGGIQPVSELRAEVYKDWSEGDKAPPSYDVASLVRVYNDIVHCPVRGWMRYTGTHWREMYESEMLQVICEMEPHPSCLAIARTSLIKQHLLRDCGVQQPIEWNQLAEHEIPLRNGIYSLRDATLRPHAASDWVDAVIPHDLPDNHFDLADKSIFYDQLFRTWFPENTLAKVRLFQEFLGYALMPHNMYKKALFLLGGTDTGKSTALELFRVLVGSTLCSHVDLSRLSVPFAFGPLVGSHVNLTPEVGKGAWLDDGLFKNLVSSGEEVPIERKYRDTLSYRLKTTFVAAMNNLPGNRDHSDALTNRVCIIRFDHKLESKNVRIFDEISAHGQELLAGALIGAQRLYDNRGVFSETVESREEVAEYATSQDLVAAWVEDRCQLAPMSPDHEEEGQKLLHDFREYSGQRMNLKTFTGELRRVGDKLDFNLVKNHRGQKRWRGIRLHPDYEPKEY